MTKRLRYGLIAAFGLLLCVCLAWGGTRLSAHAEGTVNVDYSFDVTVTARRGDTVVGSLNAISDPYTNLDISAGGHITQNDWSLTRVSDEKTVVYTAAWLYSTSRRTGNFTEYQVVSSGNSAYRIEEVSGDIPAGEMYIPAGGFVVSVPNGTVFGQKGDTVTITAQPKSDPLQSFRIPTMAVESSDGDRIAIDNLNANRSGPMVVYYDYQAGDKTGTNAMGTEMAAQYDEAKNAFVVTAFRDLYEGDDSGMEIPEGGFVLSAYGEGYRGILQQGKRFSLGDELSLVGFDYVRFGGSVTYPFNFINPTLEENPAGYDSATDSPFPAFRGTNQLIVYRDGWSYEGRAGTGTNIYGYEVAVNEHGVVIERNVNVSKIPENGYVLSGHGTGRDFLQSNVPMGATVELNEADKTFTATTSLNSFYTNVATSLQDAVNTAETRLNQLYDLDRTLLNRLLDEATTACDELETLKDSILEEDPQGAERTRSLMRFNSLQLGVESLTRSIISATVESSPVAARAVWHRPTERSLDAIRESLEVYRDCGFNLIFVESFYGGMSLFKSEYVPYHVNFRGYTYGDYPDYLTAFAAEAQNYGIEVHAWVEDFYVGIDSTHGVYAEHPDWVLYNDDDTILQRNEGGEYIFIDPANEEVTDFLIDYYKELIEKVPNIKGLNLDYIRYPVSSREADVGFTDAAMNGFAAAQGLTLTGTTREERSDSLQKQMKRTANGGNANYNAWVAYRTQLITDFVERVKDEVKGDSDLLLSTAVFPSITESKEQKKQDWQTWFRSGWIDIATPMAYYDSPTDILEYVRAMIDAAGSVSYYYTGLASSYRGLPAYQNASQSEASAMAGANGYVIFCSTQILGHEDVQEVLKAGINSAGAILPHASAQEVLEAFFTRIEENAEELYIPNEYMTEAQLTLLKAEFARISAIDARGATGLRRVVTELTDLREYITDYAVGFAARRIESTLDEAINIMTVKRNRAITLGIDPPAEQQPGGEGEGGNTPGGDNPGGTTPGGEGEGGNTPGGTTPGGDTPGGDTPGGTTPGGTTPGGTTPGGTTPGGTTGDEPQPNTEGSDEKGCGSVIIGAGSALLAGVAALAFVVTKKKRI